MIGSAIRYCSACGHQTRKEVPEGDQRERDVCDHCHTIHYVNPRVVTGCLPVYQGKVLLCKRAIEPRKGFWTLPGGFMELGETIEQGALRETWEEACANVTIESLYILFNVVHVGHLSAFFLSTLERPEFAPGDESEEVALFSEEEIPWDALAFSTIATTLKYYFSDRQSGVFPMRIEAVNPPAERRDR
ncbi:NUDIX hydrolase [Endozoicomonas ascidiicola]|uniref:NUDIX hydrolase n=1 Tax=Endozoicomonas ascidiicola TaxID=1698521 RepID=UPI000AE94F48|nr:NUDIX hydrolase [Endozoicomonas ascidiicola]